MLPQHEVSSSRNSSLFSSCAAPYTTTRVQTQVSLISKIVACSRYLPDVQETISQVSFLIPHKIPLDLPVEGIQFQLNISKGSIFLRYLCLKLSFFVSRMPIKSREWSLMISEKQVVLPLFPAPPQFQNRPFIFSFFSLFC